jgi:hypothetical protein
MSAAEARPERYEPNAAKIADALKTRGQYVARVDRMPRQCLVDVQWTAYRAARLLGIRIDFCVDTHAPSDDPFVTVTVSPRVQGPVRA